MAYEHMSNGDLLDFYANQTALVESLFDCPAHRHKAVLTAITAELHRRLAVWLKAEYPSVVLAVLNDTGDFHES